MEERRKLRTTEFVLIFILILAVIGLCLLSIYIFQTVGSGNEPAPAATPTFATPTDTGLCLIDGKLVVGTSADYPPFETFTSQFTLDGFDIALMSKIAEVMGVPLEFHNIAFDGLGSALQLDQINAAISAISVTPEREAEFAFSNVYFVGSSAILAPPGSQQGPITSADQIASSRVGVQDGTVYQTWVQTTLIDTGKMPAGNLYSYPTIDLAINDLITGKIDLVLLDAGPARKFADQGSAKLVNEGLTQQRYAIALRQDCPLLRDRINSALTQLQNDGTMDLLVQAYLNLNPDEVEPLPTPQPTAPPPVTVVTATPPVTVVTATPPAGCLDGMALVKDLTYPDNNMTNPPVLLPGTPFQKGWRIKNTGTCVWNQQYVLVYAGGNSPYSSMGGVPTPVAGLVQPGQTYDLYINLVAPAVPGTYQGFWQLTNPARKPFGERIWVGIQVQPPNPATPTSAPNAPAIYRFLVNPLSIQFGQCVQISWETTGNVTAVNIYRAGTPIWVNGPAIGTLQDCPTAPGQIQYQIQATGPGGTARADQIVTVTENLPPTATIPPQPPPQITIFDVQPASIELGQCVAINWTVNGTVDLVRLLRNGQAILDNAPNTGSVSDCPPNSGSVVYRLEASGLGQTVSAERAISVTEKQQPQPPFVGIQWVLIAYSDRQGGTVPVIEGTETTAVFDTNGGISGQGGCNSYSGRYTAAGSSITIVVENSTKQACSSPEGLMDQENTFFSLLQASRIYQYTNNQFILYGPDNQVYLVFEPGIQPR